MLHLHVLLTSDKLDDPTVDDKVDDPMGGDKVDDPMGDNDLDNPIGDVIVGDTTNGVIGKNVGGNLPSDVDGEDKDNKVCDLNNGGKNVDEEDDDGKGYKDVLEGVIKDDDASNFDSELSGSSGGIDLWSGKNSWPFITTIFFYFLFNISRMFLDGTFSILFLLLLFHSFLLHTSFYR